MLVWFGLIRLVIGAFVLPALLLGTLFWVWMLVDCARHESNQGNDKLVWILIILCTHFLGAVAYFFARRPQRLRELGG